MRSLLPLTFVPLLVRANFLNSVDGGTGWGAGGKPDGNPGSPYHTGDAGWTGIPGGAPPNFPTGNFGGPKNSAPAPGPAPSPAPSPAPGPTPSAIPNVAAAAA